MKMTDEQIDLIKRINAKLERGDKTRIAKNTDFTKEYVGSVLNPLADVYNDEIISAAVNLIAEREQGRKEVYEKMPA